MSGAVLPPSGDGDRAGDPGRPVGLIERLKGLRSLDIEVATRAAIAAAVPLLILVALGRVDWAPYASFGAMAALYGRSEPYETRWRSVSTAAVGMVVSVGLGILVAVAGAPLGLVAAVLGLVIVGGVLLTVTLGLFPPTPLFFVFGFLICAEIPTTADEIGIRMVITIAAAGFAVLLSLSGWVLRRAAGGREGRYFSSLGRLPTPRPRAYRDAAVWINIAQLVLGSAVAGSIALLAGVGHPTWAVVSVVAVVPPPRAPHSASRSVHRIIGTVIGVGVSAAVLLPDPPAVVIVLVIAVCQFAAEILVGRNYGAALVFVTPLALSISHLASTAPVPGLLLDRVIATTLGATVGLLAVLTARFATRRSDPAAG
ncbi:FUSC family protein [Leifsonia flava]|uniref:FUSC family protein n=1 Tax=Orlajensenia leifsoniae TaxID=2561933 RepID=UPI001F000234|nr:FUSC family protein [Leifsonia flava]